MNKSIIFIPFITYSFSGYSEEVLNINDIQKYQKLHSKYAQEKNWLKAAETDAELRQLLPASIPSILTNLSKIPELRQKLLLNYLRKLPDEDYLKVVVQLIKHVDLTSPLQSQFLESIIFEPFEGERDNLLAMNWRDQRIRDMCLTLEKKLSSSSPYKKNISSILNGSQFRDMMSNALEHGELRIPHRLGRKGYAPAFNKWGEKEQKQIESIKELHQAWNKAYNAFIALETAQDVPQVNQAWEDAAQKAKIVMEMCPPDTEEAQKRVGKFFYDTVFLQHFFLSPAAKDPNSPYQKILKKLIQLNETNEKLLSQLKAFGQFQKEMNNPDSYLNEEAIYLYTEKGRQEDRNKRLSRGR